MCVCVVSCVAAISAPCAIARTAAAAIKHRRQHIALDTLIARAGPLARYCPIENPSAAAAVTTAPVEQASSHWLT